MVERTIIQFDGTPVAFRLIGHKTSIHKSFRCVRGWTTILQMIGFPHPQKTRISGFQKSLSPAELQHLLRRTSLRRHQALIDLHIVAG